MSQCTQLPENPHSLPAMRAQPDRTAHNKDLVGVGFLGIRKSYYATRGFTGDF